MVLATANQSRFGPRETIAPHACPGTIHNPGCHMVSRNTMSMPICLWSGPRNVSTALMYSFAQRSDIRVVDEPLYGHYLRVSGADHPGRDEVLAAMNCDGDTVMSDLLQQQFDDPSIYVFQKHMAHHLIGVDRAVLKQSRNVLMVRDPREMLPSLVAQLPRATLFDTGLKQQWELYKELTSAGQSVAVIDSRELLLHPEHVLRSVCDNLHLNFDPRMLAWDAGPRPEDGVWATHWYHAVHKSTGFSAYQRKPKFPELLQPLLAECRPWYDKLYEHALRRSAAGVQQ